MWWTGRDRLMRRPMVDAIAKLSEYNRFSKGIFACIWETEYLEYKNVGRRDVLEFWSLFKYWLKGSLSDAPFKHCLYWWTVILDFGLYHDDFDVIRTLVLTSTVILSWGGFHYWPSRGKYIGKIFGNQETSNLCYQREKWRMKNIRVLLLSKKR